MKKTLRACYVLFVMLVSGVATVVAAETKGLPRVTGDAGTIYPHLAMFNDESECGTGAVVPWAGRLWATTYGPHLPLGSSDKLYEITRDLQQHIRPESVGGTHANRMIHRETKQLLIGSYVIDSDGNVRVIPPSAMPGRLTGTARHLIDPQNKVYYATMEEGLYEVDLHSLEVTGLIKDGNPNGGAKEIRPAAKNSTLPGYHGKGLTSGQGRLVYANNGDQGPRVMTDPSVPSGALAEWRPAPSDEFADWTLIRRNQFTDVTTRGGISGSEHHATDPIWSIGWDHRSLLLMVLDGGSWSAYRLPKASHTYDGAHGWHTEWPRIRDIGEDDLLMTMHGTLWRFPRDFSAALAIGIRPRSSHLKIIGDFCRWDESLVFGCDDTAKSEFTNKRKAKGDLVGPGQSQSNLWFLPPENLDTIGPVIGRGAVWLGDTVAANVASEPMLFAGYEIRTLTLAIAPSKDDAKTAVGFRIEIDRLGDNNWKEFQRVACRAGESCRVTFAADEAGEWIRIVPEAAATGITAMFNYRKQDDRAIAPPPIARGLASPTDTKVHGGILHARGGQFKTLRFVATNADGDIGTYDLDGSLQLCRVEDAAGTAWTRTNAAIPESVIVVESSSLLYEDTSGRWRLPKGDPALAQAGPLGRERLCREVCTERDLFNAGGTFFELPTENAGGFAKIRPVATHNRRIIDYASYRGMLVMSGITDGIADANSENSRVIRSDDGRCAVWVGMVDDLWSFGKPRGVGGPWDETTVAQNERSDPYLMTGYDRKSLVLRHTHTEPVTITVELDIAGTGVWTRYDTFRVNAAEDFAHVFPESLDAYWIRFVCDTPTKATTILTYE